MKSIRRFAFAADKSVVNNVADKRYWVVVLDRGYYLQEASGQ